MKKFYPNLKNATSFATLWILLATPLCVCICMGAGFDYLWIAIYSIGWSYSLPIIILIYGSLSLYFKEDSFIYRKFFFSSSKKILLQDVNNIVLKYGRRKKIISIIINNGEVYSFDINLNIITLLVSLFPHDMFKINSRGFSIPEKHIEFLLSKDILDKNSLERNSESVWDLHIDIERSCFVFKTIECLFTKRISFKNVSNIIIDYRYKPRVWILVDRAKIYYFDIEFDIIKQLISLLPQKIFYVKFYNKDRIPNKDREFLLSTDILGEEQRKTLS